MNKAIRISDFLHRKKHAVKLEPEKEYALVTVKLHHKGVILREKKKGKYIHSNMHQISKGQFILSGIDARNGAFGVVPDELDGAIVTNDFWYFDIDEKLVKRDFFYWLTNTPVFLDACIKSSKGETQRIRLQKDLFFNIEFHFPSIDRQESFLKKIQGTDDALNLLKYEQINQSNYLSQLRQTILQEAVEGKLTAKWRKQNPKLISGENHASKLLEKIKAEKATLIKEEKIRKDKPLPPIANDEKPFDLPNGWVWCRLGKISQIFAGYSFNSYDFKIGNGIKCIKITNAGVQEIVETDDRLPESFLTKYTEFLVKEGDLIIALTRPYISAGLKISKCPKSYNNALLNQRVAAIRQAYTMNFEYIYFFMITDFVLNGYKEKFEKANLQPNLRMDDIKELKIPLPPIAEQHAIVERVDKLMATIGELEKQVTERKEQSEMLMQSVLREAFEKN